MAIKYKGTPIIKPNGNMYELCESLKVVYTTDDGEIKAVLVPKGYLTDGASIPKFLWEEVGCPFDPQFMTAAIVHDYHCNIRDGVVKISDAYQITVDEMSELFFDLLLADGVFIGKAWLMEQAVRVYKSIF